MTFGAPYWLWALISIPALVAFCVRNGRRRRELLRQIVASRLHDALAGSVSTAKRRAQFFLLLAGLVCVIVSLAQPRFGYTWEQAKRKGRDVIIAIDTSKSMLATDVAPNRLTRAKMAAQDLIGILPGDRVGLIAFAGSAFLQAPLTIDYTAVLSSINELDTDIIPRGGTNIAEAIRIAADAFGKGESENRCLIIFTDGEELDESGVVAARQQAANFRVFTVGVGSAEGSIIPVPGEGGGTSFVKDARGQIVKSRLDENRLREIAETAGGFYLPLGNGPATMQRIVNEGFGQMKEREIDARQSRRPIERYQWPLGLGILLIGSSLLLTDRKRPRAGAAKPAIARSAAVALAVLLFPCAAFSANTGVELYRKENYKGAYESFKKQLERQPDSSALHFDAGTAAYKLGEYDKALDAFSKAMAGSRDPQLRVKSQYNLANTLFERGAMQKEKDPKLKEWRNAIQHYEEALKVDPKNKDAEYNRDVVRKLIEELEKEPPKQDEKDQKQDQKDQKQDQKDQKDQKQDQQSKSDQDKKDQQDSKQEQSKDDKQKQDQSGSKDQQKSQQGKDENKEDKSEQQKQDSDSKKQQDEAKNGEQKKQDQQQQAGNKPQDNKAQAGSTPEPLPTPSDKKLSGDIKAQSTPGEKSNEQPTGEAAVPVEPGQMTEAQARALIESLKGEDERVQLERKRTTPVLKDW